MRIHSINLDPSLQKGKKKEKRIDVFRAVHLPFDTDLAIGREGNIDFAKRFTTVF